jgi:hypothetical protein
MTKPGNGPFGMQIHLIPSCFLFRRQDHPSVIRSGPKALCNGNGDQGHGTDDYGDTPSYFGAIEIEFFLIDSLLCSFTVA